jgi:hypothetical protein
MCSNFHIHVSVSNLNIPKISLPILLKPSRQIDPGNILIAHSRCRMLNYVPAPLLYVTVERLRLLPELHACGEHLNH